MSEPQLVSLPESADLQNALMGLYVLAAEAGGELRIAHSRADKVVREWGSAHLSINAEEDGSVLVIRLLAAGQSD